MAVFGSQIRIMSLDSMLWKPRIDEPSKPNPSSKAASAENSSMGCEKCCHWPKRSVNFTSTTSIARSVINFCTSSGVMSLNLRNMGQDPSCHLDHPVGQDTSCPLCPVIAGDCPLTLPAGGFLPAALLLAAQAIACRSLYTTVHNKVQTRPPPRGWIWPGRQRPHVRQMLLSPAQVMRIGSSPRRPPGPACCRRGRPRTPGGPLPRCRPRSRRLARQSYPGRLTPRQL